MELKNKNIITLTIILAATMFACFILTAGALAAAWGMYPPVLYGMDITMTIFWSIGSLGLAAIIGFKIFKDRKWVSLALTGTASFFILMHFIYICVLASQGGGLAVLPVVLFVVSILLTVFMIPEVLPEIKKLVKKPAKAKTIKSVKAEKKPEPKQETKEATKETQESKKE